MSKKKENVLTRAKDKGIFYSSIGRRAGFVNADVKLRLKPA